MLNDIEITMLRARGYSEPTFTDTASGVIASASKQTGNQTFHVEHLGRDRRDASQKLVRLIVRP